MTRSDPLRCTPKIPLAPGRTLCGASMSTSVPEAETLAESMLLRLIDFPTVRVRDAGRHPGVGRRRASVGHSDRLSGRS